ncbi:MAG: phage integrase SAM-like domain-containing protein [Candidatus Symbiothrix sp.]|jgi:hypothetical protein|nr:phage integrase SAM-like domain-containing protein [Candidatus Symbiothrix sp.]
MKTNFFLLNKNKTQTSIQAIIRYKGERYAVSIGESVVVKYWNFSTHRCRTVREFSEASFINQRLDDWEKTIKEVFNEFGTLIIPTNKMVQDAIKNKIKSQNQEQGGIVEEDEKQYIIKYAKKYKDESNRKEHTKKHYETTIRKLEQFENRYKIKLRFIDINIDFYNKLNEWLIKQTYTKDRKEYHYSKNYIGSIFKDIKTFMNASKEAKIHSFEHLYNNCV